jgi:hypothetical protein
MRRNTHNTRWVAADGAHRTKSDNATGLETKRSQLSRHQASVSEDAERSSTRTCAPFPSHLQTRTHSPVSPTTPHRNSSICATESKDHLHLEGQRKGSDATVFPSYPFTIEKPQVKPKGKWWKSTSRSGPVMLDLQSDKLYTVAREIYKIGPQGEGQEIWKGVQDYRKKMHGITKEKQGRSNQVKSETRPIARTIVPPNVAPTDAPPRRPPRPEYRFTSEMDRRLDSFPRTESHVSRSSGEVTIGIDRSLRPIANIHKPLPSVPRQSPLITTQAQKEQSSRTTTKSKERKDSRNVRKVEDTKSSPWWKSSADKQTLKAHDELKAKISRPRPIAVLEQIRTVNVTSQCDGGGGSGAVRPPHVARDAVPSSRHAHVDKKEARRPPPLNLEQQHSERRKGKQKASEEMPSSHWCERLLGSAQSAGKPLRKRRSPDISFACVGLDATTERYVADPGPSTQGQPCTHSDFDARQDALIPEPLFIGMGSDNRGDRSSERYQAYDEILNEYSSRA